MAEVCGVVVDDLQIEDYNFNETLAE